MTADRTVLVTGVTGSIGSWMTRKFLEDGWRILALVRADGPSAAAVRARDALDVVGAAEYAGQMEAVQGDICQDDLCGRLIPRCRDASLIVHCAGVLEFAPEFAELNHRVNVLGTENLLRLAETLKVPFCHFSTAYIAGKRRGRVFEKEIDVGQEFHNAYESSKCQAEILIQSWAARRGLDVFVFRPSIVVGDSEAGRIVNFDGLYNFMHLLDSIAGTIGPREFRVVANPDATKNFVPADYVADAARHIIKIGSPGTYHITNPHPMLLSELRDIFADLFAIPGARLADEEEFRRNKPSKPEWMYRKAANSYAPYLAAEPRFDRTNTDAALEGPAATRSAITSANVRIPQMNAAFFRMLLSYARRVNWGIPRESHCKISRRVRPAHGGLAASAARSRQKLVERYFSHFLAGQMHKQLLPNLRSLSATCRIVVEDIPGRSWSLNIDRGRLEQISENGRDCQCTFFLVSDIFCSIVGGQLAPQEAFFRKNVSIEGDIETGMRLATVLAAFFRKWPYQAQMGHAR